MKKSQRYRKLPLKARVDEDGFAVASGTIITNQRLTCVAVKIKGDMVHVRDTKDLAKTTLSFSRDEWETFLAGVKHNEFNL